MVDFFYPDIGILVHGLREEFGERISGVLYRAPSVFLHARLSPPAGSTRTAPGHALSYQRGLSGRQSQAQHISEVLTNTL